MTEAEKADKLRRIVARIRGSVLNHAKLHFRPDVVANFERVTDREDGASHLRANLDSIKPSDVVALGHVLYMCSACDNFIYAGKLDKVQRWIGFAQGVLWLTGVASIDESREVNT